MTLTQGDIRRLHNSKKITKTWKLEFQSRFCSTYPAWQRLFLRAWTRVTRSLISSVERHCVMIDPDNSCLGYYAHNNAFSKPRSPIVQTLALWYTAVIAKLVGSLTGNIKKLQFYVLNLREIRKIIAQKWSPSRTLPWKCSWQELRVSVVKTVVPGAFEISLHQVGQRAFSHLPMRRATSYNENTERNEWEMVWELGTGLNKETEAEVSLRSRCNCIPPLSRSWYQLNVFLRLENDCIFSGF